MKKILPFALSIFLGCAPTFQLTNWHYTPGEPIRLKKKLSTIPEESGKNYALLIGASSEQRHHNNLSLAYQVLIEQGYERKNIFILDEDGGDPAIFPITDTLSTKSLSMVFDWLKKNLDSSDTLLIYTTGHSDRASLTLNKSERVPKSEFFSHIRDIDMKLGIVLFDQCYWGTPNWFGKSPIVFMSATSHDRTSYGDQFPRLFWKAWRRLEGNLSVLRAFEYARDNNKGTKLGQQYPEIVFSKVNPGTINLLGELTTPKN